MAPTRNLPSRKAMKWAFRSWLLECIDRGVADGFSRLLAMRGTKFAYFNDVVAGWSSEAVACLMRAGVKQLTWGELPPLPLTDAEREMTGRFRWPALGFSQEQLRNGPPVLSEQQLRLGQLDMRVANGEFRVNRAGLRKAVLAAVRPFLGKSCLVDGEYLFWTDASGLTIETSLDFGRPAMMGQVVYTHGLYFGSVRDIPERANTGGVRGISISNMLGTHTGEMELNLLTEADVAQATESIVGFARDFIAAVPGMLDCARSHERDALQ